MTGTPDVVTTGETMVMLVPPDSVPLGDDSFGDLVLRRLAESGVDTSAVARAPGALPEGPGRGPDHGALLPRAVARSVAHACHAGDPLVADGRVLHLPGTVMVKDGAIGAHGFGADEVFVPTPRATVVECLALSEEDWSRPDLSVERPGWDGRP